MVKIFLEFLFFVFWYLRVWPKSYLVAGRWYLVKEIRISWLVSRISYCGVERLNGETVKRRGEAKVHKAKDWLLMTDYWLFEEAEKEI